MRTKVDLIGVPRMVQEIRFSGIEPSFRGFFFNGQGFYYPIDELIHYAGWKDVLTKDDAEIIITCIALANWSTWYPQEEKGNDFS